MARQNGANATYNSNAKVIKGNNNANEMKFQNAAQIRKALQEESADVDALQQTLTSLRNQLFVKLSEGLVSPSDERLLLAKSFAVNSPGLPELCDLLTRYGSNFSIISLTLSSIANILSLLSTHADGHALAAPLFKSLYSPALQRRINSFLNGAQNEVLLSTLRLFLTLSNFASGQEQKQVMDGFPWGFKSVQKLPYMRRKGSTASSDMLTRPDIRTLFMQFILSFISRNSSLTVKTTLLEQHRDVFSAIFKGLHQDSYEVARHVLEACWTGIWSEPKLSKTLKIGVFHEGVFQQIMKLYERTEPENPSEPESSPADLAHHFILGLTTKPGFGICFKDQGWYPRESEAATSDAGGGGKRKTGGGKIYNKILSNIVKTLKVNEDARQHELALRILEACPELVAGFWSSAGLTLEPRLSSKWIANITFLGTAISLPIPLDSFVLSATSGSARSTSSASPTVQYKPTPPPLHSFLENILPSCLLKVFLTKGLQHSSPLVQHLTALTLAKCLIKFEEIVSAIRRISQTLEEDPEDGQWSSRLRQVQREIRKRVPEYRVVVGFSQLSQTTATSETPAPGSVTANVARRTEQTIELLSEVALRLLSLYQRCIPDAVAEVKFDTGKLLATLGRSPSPDEQEFPEGFSISRLRQLHILDLLRADTQFSWWNKPSGSNTTYLHQILMLAAKSRSQALRDAASSVVSYFMSHSILFEHDPDEIEIWLTCLPMSYRGSGATLPDDTPLTDETRGVTLLLDDCIQRCLKTPYRYLEESFKVLEDEPGGFPNADAESAERHTARYIPAVLPSPLLMTVIEQLDARLSPASSNPLPASDAVAVFSYLRMLIFRMVGKQPDLIYARALAKRMTIIAKRNLHYKAMDSLITDALLREIGLLEVALNCLESSAVVRTVSSSRNQLAVLEEFESSLPGMPSDEKKKTAYELVDWLRFNGTDLNFVDVQRLVGMVGRCFQPALPSLLLQLDPAVHSIWTLLEERNITPSALTSLPFEWLFTFADKDAICKPEVSAILSGSFLAKCQPPFMFRRLNFLLHRISSLDVADSDSVSQSLLILLTHISKEAAFRGKSEMVELKRCVFSNNNVLSRLFTSETLSAESQRTLDSFVATCLNASCPEDSQLVSHICQYWQNYLTTNKLLACKTSSPRVWISHMSSSALVDILGNFIHEWENVSAPTLASSSTLYSILIALLDAASQNITDQDITSKIWEYVPTIFKMADEHHNLISAEKLLVKVAAYSLPSGLDYTTQGLQSLCDRIRHLHPRKPPPQFHIPLERWYDVSTWSESRDIIIANLLYTSSRFRRIYLDWISSSNSLGLLGQSMIYSVHAFIESNDCSIQRVPLNMELLWTMVPFLLRAGENSTLQSVQRLDSIRKNTLAKVVKSLAAIPSTDSSDWTALWISECRDLRAVQTTAYALSRLTLEESKRMSTMMITVFRSAQSFLMEQYTDPAANGIQSTFLADLGSIAEKAELQAFDVEPLLVAVAQNRLDDPAALALAKQLLQSLAFKPAFVNKLIQTLINHPRFLQAGTSSARHHLIALIECLFSKYPSNTCQASHVGPLLQLYRGSLEQGDRSLLSIFHLFEEERRIPVASILHRWRPSSTVPTPEYQTIAETITSLDSAQLIRSCHIFTNRRSLTTKFGDSDGFAENSYDPVLILQLISQFMAQAGDVKPIQWIEILRTNIFSVVLRCLSLKDDALRRTSYAVLGKLWHKLKTVEFQEKPHILYLLDMVKSSRSLESGDRMPSHLSLFLAHALHGIIFPSHHLYPHTARHLLQRPELDQTDVPMMLGLLYSSSDEFKKERSWILRLIRDGLRSDVDWRVIRRRHVLELLTSVFEYAQNDPPSRVVILEIILEASRRSSAITTLIARHGWLSWVAMQLTKMRRGEEDTWARILHSIAEVVDLDLLDKLSDGNWRLDMHRCIQHVASSECSPQILSLLASCMLRIGNSELAHVGQGSLRLMVQQLKAWEGILSNSLAASSTEGNDLTVLDQWVQIVENVWRFSMTLPASTEVWGDLNGRMLVISTLPGASIAAEWCRCQTLANICDVDADSEP